MRWIVISCLALLVAVASIGISGAGEPEPPKPGDVAAWIRSGEPKNLDRAVNAASTFGVEQLRQVITEIRDQTLVNAVLDKKRVKALMWEDANLDTAVSWLQTVTGLNYYITPKVRSEKIEDISINLHVDDVSVRDLLDLITTPFGLTTRVRQRVVFIGTTEEFEGQRVDAPKVDHAAATLRKKIEGTAVNLSVKEGSFSDVVKTLQIQTGFNIMIDSRVAHELGRVTVSRLKLEDVALSTVLNMMAAQGGDENVIWTVKGSVILFTSKEFLEDK